MPLIQNFSVPADNDVVVNIKVNPDDGFTLTGSTIYWDVYPQQYGIPTGDPPLISKISGAGIVVTDPVNLIFSVSLLAADTQALAENYYHEACVIAQDGTRVSVVTGIMTVTPTSIRV